MSRKALSAKQGGFSLIEIIVSMSLILVAFALVLLEINVIGISVKRRYNLAAYQVVSREIETLRDMPFDLLYATGGTNFTSDQLAQLPPNNTAIYTIGQYLSYDDSIIKEITVTVTWDDGTAQSVTMQTLVQANGLNRN